MTPSPGPCDAQHTRACQPAQVRAPHPVMHSTFPDVVLAGVHRMELTVQATLNTGLRHLKNGAIGYAHWARVSSTSRPATLPKPGPVLGTQ
jgi:hypothetical protein